MRGARSPAAVDGTITAAQPASIASVRDRDRARRVDERDEPDREQPVVGGAELRHGAVLRRAAGVEAVGVAPGEHRGGERREHELALEAEQVEGATALVGIERAERVPALVREQPLLGGRRASPDPSGGRWPGPWPSRAAARTRRRHRGACGPVRGVEVLVEEVGQLHHVAVGVEDPPVAGVGHGASPWSVVLTGCHDRRCGEHVLSSRPAASRSPLRWPLRDARCRRRGRSPITRLLSCVRAAVNCGQRTDRIPHDVVHLVDHGLVEATRVGNMPSTIDGTDRSRRHRRRVARHPGRGVRRRRARTESAPSSTRGATESDPASVPTTASDDGSLGDPDTRGRAASSRRSRSRRSSAGPSAHPRRSIRTASGSSATAARSSPSPSCR